MSSNHVIGIDIGTTTISVIVLNSITGEVIDKITEKNDAHIKSNHLWEKTEDPTLIYNKVNQILDSLIDKYPPISCIGVTGQMHGIVYVNEYGQAVSPLFDWQDLRGDIEYQEGLSYAQHLSKITGYQLASGFGMVTHFYNTINRIIPDSAVYICTVMDYIVMKLCGKTKPLMHPSNAASLGCFNLKTNHFDEKVLKAVNIETKYLPHIIEEEYIVGKMRGTIPVSVAIGDNQASFLGSVRDSKEDLLINIGTSSQISVFTQHHYQLLGVETRPLTKNSFIMVGSPLCGGKAYALLEKFFNEVVSLATGSNPNHLYKLMQELARDYEAVEDPLVIATQFSGTREDPSIRGSISNLSINNFTPKHFVVGILRGIVEELYSFYQILEPKLKKRPERLIGSGNALRLNGALRQMITHTFNMPLYIPFHHEEASYGAALFALVASGLYEDLYLAQKLIRYTKIS